MFPAKTSTVDGHSHLFRVFRGWGQCLIQESRFQVGEVSLFFAQNIFQPCLPWVSAAETQGRHWEHRDCIKWRRRRKFLRIRCKNLAFYTTEPLNEPFFAEQKMKNGAAGKKNSRNIHFSKALPWFNHGSRRGKNAGEKIESALIWGRHLQKGLVKSVGFFFPSRFLCFFFFF